MLSIHQHRRSHPHLRCAQGSKTHCPLRCRTPARCSGDQTAEWRQRQRVQFNYNYSTPNMDTSTTHSSQASSNSSFILLFKFFCYYYHFLIRFTFMVLKDAFFSKATHNKYLCQKEEKQYIAVVTVRKF